MRRVVGDISWDELEVSPSELVVIPALNVGLAPVAFSVGGRRQLGVQLELIRRRRGAECPSKLSVVGGGEAGDGLLQGDGAQQEGEGDHQVEGGTGGVDMKVQPVLNINNAAVTRQAGGSQGRQPQ